MIETGMQPNVDRVIDAAQDSIGRAFRLDEAGAVDLLLGRARDRGLRVVEIHPDPEVHAFELGVLLQVLAEEGDGRWPLPRVGSVTAPPAVNAWLTREIEDRFRVLSVDGPAVFVLRTGSGIDSATRAWLDMMVEAPGNGSSTWIIVGDLTPRRGALFFDQGELSEDMLLIAQTVAVLDAAPMVDEVIEITGLPRNAVEVATTAMRALGLLARHGEHVALTDPSATERLRRSVPESLRVAIRRTMVATMHRRGVPSVVLAGMAEDSAAPDDELSVDVLADAMRQLAGRRMDAAVDIGLAATRLLTRPSPRLTELAWELLPLLWRAGRDAEARELATRVFSEDGRAEAEARVLVWLARIEASSDRALEFVDTALGLEGTPPTLRSPLLTLRIRCLSGLGREHEVDRALPEAMALSGRLGDAESLSRLHVAAGTSAINKGSITAALGHMRSALTCREQAGIGYAEWVPELMAPPLWMAFAGDREAGLALIDEAKAALPPDGGPATPLVLSTRAQILLINGDLNEAYDEAVAAMTVDGAEPDSAPILIDRFHSISVSVRLKVALHRGDLHELRLIRRWFGDAPSHLNDEMSQRIRWWQLWLDEALVMNSPGTRLFSAHDLPTVPWADLGDEVRFVRGLLVNGMRAPATAILDRAQARVDGNEPHPLTATVLSHIRGLLSWDIELLRAAADGWERLNRPWESASAHSDLGIRLLEMQDPAAVAILLGAHDRLVALGALHDAWRLRWALRARVPALGIGSLPPVALTPMESRVVRAAVEGATVNQIAAELGISPHTVDAHLRHVYTKHNLSSRSELLAWSRRN